MLIYSETALTTYHKNAPPAVSIRTTNGATINLAKSVCYAPTAN